MHVGRSYANGYRSKDMTSVQQIKAKFISGEYSKKPKYDDKLVEICKRIVKGKAWLSEHENHPNFEGALRLYESLVNRLSVYQKTESDVETILETAGLSTFDAVFGGLVEEVK